MAKIKMTVHDEDTVHMDVEASSGFGGTRDHTRLENRDASNQHPMSAITGLNSAISGKQDTISDLATIRRGASKGATAVQPSELNRYATKSYVNDTAEALEDEIDAKQDKISDLATIRSGAAKGATAVQPSTLNSYAKKTYVDNADNALEDEIATKQDRISDLSTIRSGAAKGATAVQPSAIADMATKTWVNNRDYATETYVNNKLAQKQDKLTAGENIEIANNVISADVPDVVDSVTSTSVTDALSANQGKALNDRINNLSNIGRFLALWDCTTGLPLTNPSGYPYQYHTGDYFRVNKVGDTNYMPEGSVYQGIPSTTIYTGEIAVGDIFFYDGTVWNLQVNHESGGKVQDVYVNGESVLSDAVAYVEVPIELSELASDSTHRLVTDTEKATWSGKQDAISDLATIRSGAAKGNTAVQPDAISDMATKTWVAEQDYATNEALDGKQDAISDLDDIRSGAALGETAVQPAAIADMATETWVESQGYLNDAPSDDKQYARQNGAWTEVEASSKANIEKLDNYLYKVTYMELPEFAPTDFSAGGCSSYVQDGKLYRNLDWDYNEDKSFIVACENFTGMAFGELADIDTLPYKVVDGVNSNGIMVATHIIYNDWEWAEDGDIPLYKLPFIALTTMETIEDIENLPLDNLCAVESLGEYIAQYIITDGTTTYTIAPSDDGDYIYVDITDNPKLTNFRWVEDTEVSRENLQNRPTGVERWNMMPCELSELAFTKAYQEPTRLSEFIGIDDTTKDSTDEELAAIYETAHAIYLERERDGSTWQTMHSVVYSPNGMQELFIQENWNKNYASGSAVYTAGENITIDDNVISLYLPNARGKEF